MVDAAWITGHGYKWPQDVETIPAPALAALPNGEPVLLARAQAPARGL